MGGGSEGAPRAAPLLLPTPPRCYLARLGGGRQARVGPVEAAQRHGAGHELVAQLQGEDGDQHGGGTGTGTGTGTATARLGPGLGAARARRRVTGRSGRGGGEGL